MNYARDVRILIALEHHAEGLTFEQIAARHGIKVSTAYWRYRSALQLLSIPVSQKITAQDIGLALRRRIERRPASGTPEWMFRIFEDEYKDDALFYGSNMRYRG